MRRNPNLRQPKLGKIQSIEALIAETNEVIYNSKYMWGNRIEITTKFRLKVPGRVECTCGDKSEAPQIMNQTLISDYPIFEIQKESDFGIPMGATNPNVGRAYAAVNTLYFDDIMFYIKLRWLLKVHSGLMEVDSNICSLKDFIGGLHILSVQQCEQIPSDNTFERRLRPQMFSPKQVLEDFMDQLEKGMGRGYDSFMSFVASCDPKKALNLNQTDIHMARISSNQSMEKQVEETFISYFLQKQPQTNKLGEVLRDIAEFGIPVPRIQPLRIDYVLDFAACTTHKARHDREKGAQYESIQIVANIELMTIGAFEEIDAAEIEAEAERLAGDEHAVQEFKKRKPKINLKLYQACFHLIGHQFIFLEGLRKRLLELLKTKYSIQDFMMSKLTDLQHINLDMKLLTEEQILNVIKDQKLRILDWAMQCPSGISVIPFLGPSWVGMPLEWGGDACYWQNTHTSYPNDMRNIPDVNLANKQDQSFIWRGLKKDGRGGFKQREEFVVPMMPGPLTSDPVTRELRTTGYFVKMDGALI